jgi:hypothetical protein
LLVSAGPVLHSEIFGSGKSMDWIELVQNRVQWQALVKIIVSIKGVEFLYELCDYQLQN